MDSLLIQNAVIVPLYYDRVLRFTQNNISGFESNAMNLLDLKRVVK
jgi:peptide/nickel transport system substrate-binding protein